MKKTFIILAAIALLGILAVYTYPQLKNNNLKDDDSTSLIEDSDDDSVSSAPASTVAPTASPTVASSSSTYKDGTYTGSAESFQFGTVQVAAVIAGGKITAVNFLQLPDGDSRSSSISSYVKAPLVSDTLASQSANVDTISGATYTTLAYKASLQAAIDQAKI
jgi:uncharacterized protein with FMN-binding domain